MLLPGDKHSDFAHVIPAEMISHKGGNWLVLSQREDILLRFDSASAAQSGDIALR